MCRTPLALGLLVCLALFPAAASGGTPTGSSPGAAPDAHWPDRVATVFRTYCTGCHGGVKRSGGLDLRTMAGLAAGADSGAILVPGDIESSRLWQVLQPDADLVMPPEGRDRPTDSEKALIVEWIARLPADALESWLRPAGPDPEDRADSLALPPGIDPEVVIDLLLQSAWVDAGATPAPRCDDATFVRRVYLDLVGRIPTLDEAQAFLDDPHSRKREELIDRLLASSEHAAYLAEVFNVVLMGRKGPRAERQRVEHGWREFLEQAFQENRPWDEIARTILLARPEEPNEQGAVWYLYERKDDHQAIAEAVASGFLGIQIQCAQCHDHPLWSDLKQAHYWGMVSFFTRSKNASAGDTVVVAESAIGGFREYTDLDGVGHRTQLTFLEAPVVDEDWPQGEQEDSSDLYLPGAAGSPRVPKFSRREALVEQVLLPHPRLARAMVNRLWALLMGRGLVHPVDRMDALHPPSHPRLLDWLAEDFRQSGYDIRRLIRGIVRSRAYQLESIPASTSTPPELFAFGLEKPLTAEAHLRSVVVALRQKRQPDMGELLPAFREAFPDVLPETVNSSVQQALLLSNHEPFQQLFRSGLATELAGMPDAEQRIDRAFAAVFCRAPTESERQAVRGYWAGRADRMDQAVQQVLWAMLGSAEFRLNH